MFNRGEVMNGGFGLVLDGSEEAGKRARMMLNWDVSNGVSGFLIDTGEYMRKLSPCQHHVWVQPRLYRVCYQ